MEKTFGMEWKIFSMEWKKIASMEYGKIVFHSIPYHALQPRPHREILSRSAFTETENYDCVLQEMSAMMNDHAISITITN